MNRLPDVPYVQPTGAPGVVLVITDHAGFALHRLCEVDEAVALMEQCGWSPEAIAVGIRRGNERLVRRWN